MSRLLRSGDRAWSSLSTGQSVTQLQLIPEVFFVTLVQMWGLKTQQDLIVFFYRRALLLNLVNRESVVAADFSNHL